MNRTAVRQQSVFANPVLVGAVTVLIVVVAVFLAYNANEGLPFVPTRELKVDIADTSPIRNPPSRTSLPTTRFEPSAISTFSSRVGTNGNPSFAL